MKTLKKMDRESILAGLQNQPASVTFTQDSLNLDLHGLKAHIRFENASAGGVRAVAEVILGRVPFTAENAILRREVLARVMAARNGSRNAPALILRPDQLLSARHGITVPSVEGGHDRLVLATTAFLPLMPLIREFKGFLPAA